MTTFVASNGISKYSSALRAYKFAIKHIYRRPKRIRMEEGEIKLEGTVSLDRLHELYKKHMPLFIALDAAQVRISDWILMDLTEEGVYLLLSSSEARHLSNLLEDLSDAVKKARGAEWGGRIFYKVIGAGGQNEIGP